MSGQVIYCPACGEPKAIAHMDHPPASTLATTCDNRDCGAALDIRRRPIPGFLYTVSFRVETEEDA